jgi:hypothetical protein
MDNKTDLDKLMYLLGQENAVEELNRTTESHEFSEKYKSERMKIINNQDSFQSINKKRKKIMKKKIIVLIAAITATLAISATAYGTVRQYLFTTSRNEETGTLTYNFEEEAPITKIPVIKITPGYIPEGYIEKEHTPGKYHPNGDFSLGGISIFQSYCLDGSEEPYVSSVEETIINGIKAHIITREGLEYNHVIKLFYEDGQIIDIMAADSVPFDEVKKVAENIKYEVIPGEFIDIGTYSEENEIKVIPGYIPKGYMEYNNSGRYYTKENPNVADIFMCSSYERDDHEGELSNDPTISNVEETTIGGVKAKIYKGSETADFNYMINLFYEENKQIAMIVCSNAISLDELKKIAENLKFQLIPLQNITPPVITADNIFNIGEEKAGRDDGPQFGLHDDRSDKPNYTVNKIEVLDKLPELDKNYFCDYNQYLEFINEDGTLKDYERVNEQKWENNKMNTITETVGRMYVYVTLTMKNPFNKELKDINIYPRVYSLSKTSDNTFEKFYLFGEGKVQTDGAPFYFDQSDYAGGHFYFCDFAPNETKEVHLVYAVDEDQIDNAYIHFNQSGDSAIIGNYIKVTK